MPNLIMPAYVGCVLNSANVKWTDEGREGVQEQEDERSTLVTTAAGTNIKFIKAVKKKWTLNWTMVSQNQYLTIDGCWGRDEIRNFVFKTNNGNSFTFLIDNGNASAAASGVSHGYYTNIENYTVYVDDYQETIQLRRPTGNIYNISMNLTQV